MSNPIENLRVGFVGMTHLGLVSATAVAAKGFSVIGYDSDPLLIAAVQSLQLPIEEPQLKEHMRVSGERLQFTANRDLLSLCDVLYISADVPTRSDHHSDLSCIERWMMEVLPIVQGKKIVLVILSQVPPGFTRRWAGQIEVLFYQVETLIFGQALDRALHPERFIVGCRDPKQALPSTYTALLQAFECPIFAMRYESAELAKISINLLLVSSVMAANMLAEVSTAVGADWGEIVPTLQQDQRIGLRAYIQPGLGIAGGNLERDMATLASLGESMKVPVDLIHTWFSQSDYQKTWVYRALQKYLLPFCAHPRIAILGLAYKAHTHSTKNSPSLAIIKQLQDFTIVAHDPVVALDAVPFVERGMTVEDTIKEADVIMVLTPWPHYDDIQPLFLKKFMRGRWVIDPYRQWNCQALEQAGFYVLTLGRPISTVLQQEHEHVET